MGLLDSILGGFLKSNKKTKAKKDGGLADLNKDGKVDQADFNKARDMLDVNDDGKVNKQDLDSIKEKFGK